MIHRLIIVCLSVALLTPPITAFVPSPHTSLSYRVFQKQQSIIYATETPETPEAPEAATETTETTETPPEAAKEAGGSSPDAILNSPAFLKRKLQVLQDDLTSMDDKIESAKADLEASKEEWGVLIDQLDEEKTRIMKRMETQKTKATETAKIAVAEYFFNIVDEYERTFNTVKASTDDEKKIMAEYRETFDALLKVMTDKKEGLGLKRVATVGTEFDMDCHEALYEKPDSGYEPGLICDEFMSGWWCNERLLREAQVVISLTK